MKLIPIACLALSLVGCGNLTSERFITGRQYPQHQGSVRVILENDAPPEHYEEIAIVRAVGTGTKANLDSVFDGLRDEAHRVGANAVIRVRIDHGNGVAGIGVAVRVPTVTTL